MRAGKRAVGHAVPQRPEASEPAPDPRASPRNPSGRPVGVANIAWSLLIALAFAQAACAFVPSSWAWGLAGLRFAPPIPAWSAWVIAALALIPPVALRLIPALEWIGSAIDQHPRRAAATFGLAAAALVLVLPDRAWFEGDFLWRQIALEGTAKFTHLYPQAMPLDRLLHDVVARWLMRGFGFDANDAGRALGAVAAVAWGATAVIAARALGLRGVAAGACALALAAGGALTLMTGLDKSYAGLAPCIVLVAAFAVRVARDGRGAIALGVAFAVALLLHRSALALAPGVAIAFFHARSRASRRSLMAGVAVMIATLSLTVPRLLELASTVDRIHLAPGSGIEAWIGAVRLVDLTNVLLFYAPLLPLALVLAPRVAAAAPREARVLAAIALPPVFASLAVHPAHGVFRDTEVFAMAGVLCAFTAAWALGATIAARPSLAALGTAAVLAAAAPTVTWLLHFNDVDRAMARVEAFIAEPPARDHAALAGAWDYLGFRLLDLGRIDESARAFERTADLEPTPRVLRQWASVELRRGDWNRAASIWGRLLERDPGNLVAWGEWTALAARHGDVPGARVGAEAMLRLDPENAFARRVLTQLPAESVR